MIASVTVPVNTATAATTAATKAATKYKVITLTSFTKSPDSFDPASLKSTSSETGLRIPEGLVVTLSVRCTYSNTLGFPSELAPDQRDPKLGVRQLEVDRVVSPNSCRLDDEACAASFLVSS